VFEVEGAPSGGVVTVRPALPSAAAFYTTPRTLEGVEVVGHATAASGGQRPAPGAAALGVVRVTKRLLGFTVRAAGSGAAVRVVDVACPQPPPSLRAAVWWNLPLPALRGLIRGGEDPAAALHGAAHALRAAAQRLLGCEEGDVDVEHPGGGGGGGGCGARAPLAARVVLFDGAGGGGEGFAPLLLRGAKRLASDALALVEGCPCAEGCGGCVAGARCGAASGVLCKRGACAVLRAMER
jgi:DEAD/DEAH box helicase domain-containing protein